MAKKKKQEIFKIKQFQPNNEVTSSSIMVEVDGLKILLDLGLLQNSTDTFPQLYHKNMQKLQSIPYDELDYVVVSHAHHDHCNGLGVLGNAKYGFSGTVITTELTARLSNKNMINAYKINLKEVCKYNNIKHENKKKYELYYSLEDIETVMSITHCYGYNEKIKLNENVTLELLPASHLPGASMIYLIYTDKYTTKRLLYTGDITYGQKYNRPFTMSIDDKRCLKVDYLIMESTYGLKDREVNEEENFIDYLEKAILDEVVDKNRILYIGSFAIHRATVLYYALYQIFTKNKQVKEANIPVIFCGQLMKEAHNIIGSDSSFCYYDEEWQDKRDIWRKEPFNFITDSMDLNTHVFNNARKIVISSNGMLDKGFSAPISEKYLSNKKVTVLSCGYQAENSLGWKVQQGFKEVEVNNRKITVRSKYFGTIPSLSGHANHRGLISFVKSLNQHVLKDIILVHGTDEAKMELKEDLENTLSANKNIHIIKQFETLKF